MRTATRMQHLLEHTTFQRAHYLGILSSALRVESVCRGVHAGAQGEAQVYISYGPLALAQHAHGHAYAA